MRSPSITQMSVSVPPLSMLMSLPVRAVPPAAGFAPALGDSAPVDSALGDSALGDSDGLRSCIGELETARRSRRTTRPGSLAVSADEAQVACGGDGLDACADAQLGVD